MSFYVLILHNFQKSFFFEKSANAKGLEIVWLPRQNDFRTFCISNEDVKVYQKLEEAISIY